MLRKILAGACATCLLFLCGCTKQHNIDPAEFCRRYNEIQGEEVILPERFFKEQGETSQETNCNFPFWEGYSALLSLQTDTDGTVTGFQLTCIREGTALSTEGLNALYKTYVDLAAVLTVSNREDAENTVRAAGLLPESLVFADYGFVGEADGHQYSVFSGEMYISLFCGRV